MDMEMEGGKTVDIEYITRECIKWFDKQMSKKETRSMISFLSQLDDKDFLHYTDVIEKLHSYDMTQGQGNTNVVEGVDEVGDGQCEWSTLDQRAKVQSCLEVLRRQRQEDEREKCDQILPLQQ